MTLNTSYKESAAPAAVKVVNEPTASSGIRVLIVEDNPDLRALFTRVFEWHKFEISLARDGVEAVEMLAEDPPDLVVLDVNMPRMNGLQVLKYIRAEPALKHLKVIVATGNSMAVHAPEADYADLFLVKPIAIVDLVNFTKRLLSAKASPAA